MFSIFVVQWIILKCLVESLAGVQFCLTKWFLLNRHKRAQRSLISNTHKKAFVKYCNTSFYINSTILQFKLRKSCVFVVVVVFSIYCMKRVHIQNFQVRIFPHSDRIRRFTLCFSEFSPNAGKYGPEKHPPNTDTFCAGILNSFFYYRRRVKDPVKHSS